MKRKYWVLLAVCTVILGLDQWTKALVQQKLPLHQRVEVIPGFFNLTHVRNPGGAFGIFGGAMGSIGSTLFVIVSLLAIGILVFLFAKVKEHEKNLTFSYSLILSGAIGNLVDRFRFGEVIDFLDYYISSFHWPAFNIADAAICAGIGLMAIELFSKDTQKAPQSSTSTRK